MIKNACLVALLFVSACADFDPKIEGPAPEAVNIVRSSFKIFRIDNSTETLDFNGVGTTDLRVAFTHRTDGGYENSVDFIVILTGAYPYFRGKNNVDSAFVYSPLQIGDTIVVSTEFLGNNDSNANFGYFMDLRHLIPGYNPENKNWRIATHLVTKLHAVNGVAVE
jgi:hypothetical protein